MPGPKSGGVPYSELTRIKLFILGSDENEIDANVYVKHQELYKQNIPYPEGIYDAHMGTTEHNQQCKSCHNFKELCPGHSGVLELNYPVQSPFFLKEIIRWLRVICFNCGKLLISYDKAKVPVGANKKKLLDYLAKTIRPGTSKTKNCPHCGAIHPLVIKEKSDNITLWIEIYDPKSKEERKPEKNQLYPHEIETIFNKITDETVLLVGKPLECHPRKLILRKLRVPPNTMRPDIKRFAGGRSGNDDLTILLQSIVKCNEKIPKNIPSEISKEFDKDIHILQLAVYEFIKGSSNANKRRLGNSSRHPLTSIAKRLPKKKGRIRGNLLGRRANHMARSFITCDPSLKIDEIGLPIRIAKEIQTAMIVREYNRDKALEYFLNGIERYPGCTKVKKYRTGNVHWIGNIAKDFTLETGDVIYRDIIDGDVVGFNRAPSLTPSEISSMHVKIFMEGDTIRMNVLSCPLFHADFDGDAMVVIFPRTSSTENETEMLASPKQRFISYQNGIPVIGEAQDSIIGTAELTKSSVQMDKLHLMQMFDQLPIYNDFSGVDPDSLTSGRQTISILLKNLGYFVNYNGKAKFYSTVHEPYITYDKSEVSVEIDHGELKSGVLDKSSIGEGARGGIFHIIHNQYGSSDALKASWCIQQLSIAFALNHGITVGLKDFIMHPEHLKEIRQIESKLITDSRMITEKLNNGQLIAPLGRSIGEYYEQLQVEALNPGDQFWPAILKSIDHKENYLYKMIMHGSKGNVNNFRAISTAIGQIEINGERIKEIFGDRTTAYFTRFDSDPTSRGYIPNSYMSGLDVTDFIFHAFENRYQLINKALSTSIPGDQSRRGVKNLESSIINNLRQVDKNGRLTDLLYGDDGVDPRFIEDVKFPTMATGLSDKDFENNFRTTLEQVDKKYRNKKVDDILSGEYKHLLKDRDFYRSIFLNREYNSGHPYKDSTLMPVNVSRIIEDTIFDLKLKEIKDPQLNPIESVQKISKLCKNITYCLMNEIQETIKSELPEYLKKATKLLRVLIRSYLNIANLRAKKITDSALDLIIVKIKMVYMRSLISYGTAVGIIAAQALSEPMTQMVIDSHRTSGLASTKKKGIFRIKEITGARDTNKMKSPNMTLHPKAQFRGNKEAVQSIANHIEMLRLRQFVLDWQLFFEKYGQPVHPLYESESKMIKNFEKYNIHVKPPSDLINWCIRFRLDKIKLVEKQMRMETIYSALRKVFPESYIVYSTDNVKNIVVRVYLRNIQYKPSANIIDDLLEYIQQMLNVVLRGVEGIISAFVKEETINTIQSDGAIKGEKSYYIFTEGTNLPKMLCNPWIDTTNIQTDSIMEIYRVYGIVAARTKIINELIDQLGDAATFRHFEIYANEMTYTGAVTSIDRYGSAKRDSNLLLRISDASPLAVIEEGAINGQVDYLSGISAPILVGKNPQIGDLYNTLKIDEEFVSQNMDIQSILDVL